MPSAAAPIGCDDTADATPEPLDEPASEITEPDSSTPFGSRPLAAASESTLTPARAAIALSVSPGRTTYDPPDPPPAPALDDAEAPAELPLSDRAVPESSTLFGLRPLAAASESTLSPARAAIALSVSPGCTT